MTSTSIIIPAYNQGRYIAATLESALAQTYLQLEIIVVDDGSTDDTPERIAPYASRVQIIRQANRGLSGARNAGFAASTGDYVLFLDSDDLLLPDALAQMARYLDEQPADGLVYCAWQQIHAETGAVMGEIHPGFSGSVVSELLLRQFFFFGSGTLLRRRALEQAGLFDETLPWGDDADMWLRLGLAGWTFGYVDHILMQYRVHPASMTASVGAHQVEGWQAGLRKFFSQADLPLALRGL
jgi:glycosyltransferase involved in cell wall biosynthesis